MGSVVIGNFAKSRMAENDLPAEAVSSPNLIDERVGERLRRRRVSLGITQMELADAAESTVQQVRQWEDGISRIEAIRLRKLAEILGVNSSFFFAMEFPAACASEHGRQSGRPYNQSSPR
jgi:ribosome-binding protein aMBF1 (putative translation factor)